jgi:membrane protease YdiL (CAAX protease family)
MRIRALTQYGVLIYFVLTFALSWSGALIVLGPGLARGETLSKQDGVLLFPVMILGPCICGISVTYLLDGATAVRGMFSWMRPSRPDPNWYLALAGPPLLICIVLFSMSRFVSRQFDPNLFWQGIFFGLPAGFLEEIGWTGFALPHMIQGRRVFSQSVLLGLLWGLWHLPAIDYLGAATPHGSYLFPFFLAFTAAMTALRVLIAWLFVKTGSLLLAQLIHASSTGALVVLSPPRVTAAAEALWYFGYAAVLWSVVAVILVCDRQRFVAPPAKTASA